MLVNLIAILPATAAVLPDIRTSEDKRKLVSAVTVTRRAVELRTAVLSHAHSKQNVPSVQVYLQHSETRLNSRGEGPSPLQRRWIQSRCQ